MYPMLIYIVVLPIPCHLQITLDDLNLLLHFLEHVRPNKEYVHWITPTYMSITTSPIQCLNQTHLYGLLVPIDYG